MEMAMEYSRSSSSHLIHSVAFETLSAAVRTRRFTKNPIPSTPRISVDLLGFGFYSYCFGGEI
ncbi:hypothetical protein QQP08_008339 [Theobroma cacao]|nr:hypothetical protein QQP08_008339 [Theobroma cacao]